MSGESSTRNTFDEVQLSLSGDIQKLHRYIELSESHRVGMSSICSIEIREICGRNMSSLTDPTPLNFSVCV